MVRAAGETLFSRIGYEGAGDTMVPAEEVVPKVHYPSYIVYDEGARGQLIKGINTEEFWLNPPFGRPRNINYNSLIPFEESEWVQICTEAIIDGVINADYDFVPREEGDDTQEDAIDEAKEWFQNLPSEETFEIILAAMLPDLLWYDAGAIIKMFPVTQYDTTGKLHLRGNDYPVLDLSVKDGRSFMIEASPVGGRWQKFWQYSWMNAGSQPIGFDLEEIIYIRMRPNSRGIYGQSRLEWIKNVVNYLMDATEQGSKIMENGLFMGGQIDHPDVKSIDELTQKAMSYKAQLQGPKKAGKWLVTGGNVKVQSFPFNNQQMQWLDGQKWYAKLVMSAFKITPSELGFTEDLNRATGMQQSNIHKSRAIKPVLRAIAREFNRCLVWKKWPGITFKYPEALDFEDSMKQAQIDEIYLRSGKVSVNELRERDGQDKFEDEKFDEPFAEQAGQEDEMDPFGGNAWNPFNDGSDTTDEEDDTPFDDVQKGGKGSGIKGHKTFHPIEFSLKVPEGYHLEWMSPQEYIDRVSIVNRMTIGDFVKADAKAKEGGRPGLLYHPPFSRESIARLKKATSQGAKIDMPSLEYGDDGLLSDQEGFHRAMIAKKIGIKYSNDEHYILNERKIPVAVKGDMPAAYRRPQLDPEDQIPYIVDVVKMAAPILDGQISDLDEREEEAEDELQKFWSNKKEALIDALEKELAEEIEKGGKGSGIKGHRTAEKGGVPMHRRFDQVLHGAKDADDVKERLNKFKDSWSEEDYENVLRDGACSTINTAVSGALKRAGFNASVKRGEPKESGNPEHYITVLEHNKRKYVIDFVAEQFLGYGIYANIDEEKAFHSLTGYKAIYNSYRWTNEG